MRKGQRASSSSESEESQRSRSSDSSDWSSPSGCSSDEQLSSGLDVEAKGAMKRSRGFSSSFSFGDDDQQQSRNEDIEEPSSKDSNGVPITITEVEEEALPGEYAQLEKTFSEGNPPQRSGLFRPQDLWLAVTRCLTLRWPPCLSISRQSNTKPAYRVDPGQSEDIQLSVISGSTNQSSSSTSTTSDDRGVTLVKREEEEVKSRVVKSGPAPRRGVSRSTPRLLRARQATDSVLASLILEKETFLRIELVESGDEREELRYRAEWKLSERTKDLAEGVWLSQSQRLMD